MLIIVSAIALRVWVMCIVTIGSDACAPTLLQGDRVAVLHQECRDTVQLLRGEWVVFAHPYCHDSLLVGRIAAQPGDTLWIDAEGHLSQRSDACDLVVVPQRGQCLQIDVQSIRLYNQAIKLHEPVKSAIVDGQLYVSGRQADTYNFAHSYYWIMTGSAAQDSRTLGLIPASCIKGRVLCVLFGHDPAQPLWQGWRRLRRP